MTEDGNKRTNPIHFESDPAYILIRINPEIRIRFPDPILALAEFAFSGCSCLPLLILQSTHKGKGIGNEFI